MNDEATPPEPQVTLPVVWVERSDPRADYVTNFMVIKQNTEYVVWLGQGQIPPQFAADNALDVSAISHVPVHVVSKLVLSHTTLRELREVLDQVLDVHE